MMSIVIDSRPYSEESGWVIGSNGMGRIYV
jgi:hypothetical protein